MPTAPSVPWAPGWLTSAASAAPMLLVEAPVASRSAVEAIDRSTMPWASAQAILDLPLARLALNAATTSPRKVSAKP